LAGAAVGYLIEETGWGLHPYWGKTIVASALSPIPILGKPFRQSSGTGLYNRLIYNDPWAVDQVVPFSGELFINFNIIGLIVGYSLFGLVIAHLQSAFDKSRNTFEAYYVFLVAYWVAFLVPGNVAIISQIILYAFWPIYGYFALRWLRSVFWKKELFELWPNRYRKTL
jgi:hypothetical protein